MAADLEHRGVLREVDAVDHAPDLGRDRDRVAARILLVHHREVVVAIRPFHAVVPPAVPVEVLARGP